MRRTIQLIALVPLALMTLVGCGGGGGGASPSGVSVTISPKPGNVVAGGSIAFTATVSGAANQTVTWSVQEQNGGSITSAGAYTAPTTPGSYHVVAVSQANTSASDTCLVTVTAPPAVSVTVAPPTPTVTVSGKQTFTATVHNTTNIAVTWSVVPGGAGGSIDTDGVYTAPAVLGTATTDTVIATSAADPTKTGTAVVTVTIQNFPSVKVAPTLVTLSPSGHQAFTATVSGDLSNSGVNWTVVETGGGTVDSSGNYTAPAVGGVFHVRATSIANSTAYADATVKVLAGSGTVVVQ